MKAFKLCYLEGESQGFMYFTDNFENQWGDDWDDAPYSCNAGEPYEYDESNDEEGNKYNGHIRKFGWMRENWEVETQYSADLSVENVNKLGYPWMFNDETKTGIKGGDSIPKVVKWCRANGVKIGELK